MTDVHESTEPLAAVERLRDAINAHDPEALAGCFTTDFHSEMPCVPEGSFVGNENVAGTWGKIFAAVPDMNAEIVRSTVSAPDCVWVEWEQTGNQTNGSAHLVRGVFIAWIADGRIAANRFYLAPVRSGPPSPLNE